MVARTPAALAANVSGKGRLPSLVWQAPLAAAIVILVWYLLETLSRLLGVWPTLILSLVLFAASLWGLARLRCR
jgi:hypothetical protein